MFVRERLLSTETRVKSRVPIFPYKERIYRLTKSYFRKRKVGDRGQIAFDEMLFVFRSKRLDRRNHSQRNIYVNQSEILLFPARGFYPSSTQTATWTQRR